MDHGVKSVCVFYLNRNIEFTKSGKLKRGLHLTEYFFFDFFFTYNTIIINMLRSRSEVQRL